MQLSPPGLEHCGSICIMTQNQIFFEQRRDVQGSAGRNYTTSHVMPNRMEEEEEREGARLSSSRPGALACVSGRAGRMQLVAESVPPVQVSRFRRDGSD